MTLPRPAASASRAARAARAARTEGPVLVVGTGLLGTSVALGLSTRGVDVALSDPSPSAAALAADLGAGRLATDGDAAAARTVVVAAPPDVTASVVARALHGCPHAVVTDVASVKARVLEEVVATGADTSRYVGGHPLAGRERSGAVAARADLFAGASWVLCPAPDTEPAALHAVRDLALDLGAAPLVMEAGEHDEAVALVSHVPQVAASLVAARLREAPEGAVGLAGQGVRDVTRIAASDPALWVQILGANAAPVGRALHRLRDDLDTVLAALDALGGGPRTGTGTAAAATPAAPAAPGTGARAALARLIAEGGEGRARIPGKHGTAPTAYASVLVLVPDAPGELARLLHEVGAAGVNLEDLRLEHSVGQPVGLAELAVLPAAQPRLVEALRAGGWTVQP